MGKMVLLGEPEEMAGLITQLFPVVQPDIIKNEVHSEPKKEPKKQSKRKLILETLQFLHKQGQTDPNIHQISQAFETRYPQEDSSNLDQVLRDLVNKTDLLERTGWGCFKLKKNSL